MPARSWTLPCSCTLVMDGSRVTRESDTESWRRSGPRHGPPGHGADGRNSQVRNWAGFRTQHDPERLVVGGVLFENVERRCSIHFADEGIRSTLVRDPTSDVMVRGRKRLTRGRAADGQTAPSSFASSSPSTVESSVALQSNHLI